LTPGNKDDLAQWGGNMDLKELKAGTKIWLPVQVEGALLFVGGVEQLSAFSALWQN
jgi:acetamidase/formamidase